MTSSLAHPKLSASLSSLEIVYLGVQHTKGLAGRSRRRVIGWEVQIRERGCGGRVRVIRHSGLIVRLVDYRIEANSISILSRDVVGANRPPGRIGSQLVLDDGVEGKPRVDVRSCLHHLRTFVPASAPHHHLVAGSAVQHRALDQDLLSRPWIITPADDVRQPEAETVGVFSLEEVGEAKDAIEEEEGQIAVVARKRV